MASIKFWLKNNRKILFTGHGLGEDIVDILVKNNMYDNKGKFFVDVLKIPHHGSGRNSSVNFLKSINARYYIILAKWTR